MKKKINKRRSKLRKSKEQKQAERKEQQSLGTETQKVYDTLMTPKKIGSKINFETMKKGKEVNIELPGKLFYTGVIAVCPECNRMACKHHAVWMGSLSIYVHHMVIPANSGLGRLYKLTDFCMGK